MVIRADVAYTVAVGAEMFLYGIYTCLFTAVMSKSVMLKRRSSERGTGSSRVFLICTIVMYTIATFHIIVQCYSFLRAFILHVEPQGYMVYYLDFQRWDNMAGIILPCVISLLGDALVIYRCYFVWNSNIWVITPPTLLLLFAIGLNTLTLFWFSHPTLFSPKIGVPFLDITFPIAFVQNVMTTGLIIFKLWDQHRASSASGATDRGSRLSLLRIMYILVESAIIYTLEIFLLIIFTFDEDNFHIILLAVITPSVGIVFVLMAVRVHAAKSSSVAFSGEKGILSRLEEGESGIELKRPAASAGVGATFTVAVKLEAEDDSVWFSSSPSPHLESHGEGAQ